MKYIIIFLMAVFALFSSCSKEDSFSTKVEQSIHISIGVPYGEFVVVNKGTNDTIVLRNSETKPVMKANNGNFISIKFVPDKEYEDQKFETIYTLHDSTTVENKMEYEYAITNTKPGDYNIRLFAKPKDVDVSTWSCDLTLKIEQ